METQRNAQRRIALAKRQARLAELERERRATQARAREALAQIHQAADEIRRNNVSRYGHVGRVEGVIVYRRKAIAYTESRGQREGDPPWDRRRMGRTSSDGYRASFNTPRRYGSSSHHEETVRFRVNREPAKGAVDPATGIRGAVDPQATVEHYGLREVVVSWSDLGHDFNTD